MTPREIDDLMGALVAKKRKVGIKQFWWSFFFVFFCFFVYFFLFRLWLTQLEESECLVEAEVLRDFLVHAREQKEQVYFDSMKGSV